MIVQILFRLSNHLHRFQVIDCDVMFRPPLFLNVCDYSGQQCYVKDISSICACVLPGSFRGMGAFYFKKEIEEPSLTQHCWPE